MTLLKQVAIFKWYVRSIISKHSGRFPKFGVRIRPRSVWFKMLKYSGNRLLDLFFICLKRLVSPANINSSLLTFLQKYFFLLIGNNKPRTDPCGTPTWRYLMSELYKIIHYHCFLCLGKVVCISYTYFILYILSFIITFYPNMWILWCILTIYATMHSLH